MAYALSWVVYVLMAVLIMFAFERYVSTWFSRQPRIFIRVLLAIVLFTPGFVSAGTVYLVPACVGILFNILAKSGDGLLKASLPMLLVSSVVFGVLFFLESRRPADELQADDGVAE